MTPTTLLEPTAGHSAGDWRPAALPRVSERRGSRLIVLGPPVRVVSNTAYGTEILLADCWTEDVDGPTAIANAALFAASKRMLNNAEALLTWAFEQHDQIKDRTLQRLLVEIAATVRQARGVQ